MILSFAHGLLEFSLLILGVAAESDWGDAMPWPGPVAPALIPALAAVGVVLLVLTARWDQWRRSGLGEMGREK